MKYLTGLTNEQFYAFMYSFLNSIYPLNDIIAYRAKTSTGSHQEYAEAREDGITNLLMARSSLFVSYSWEGVLP